MLALARQAQLDAPHAVLLDQAPGEKSQRLQQQVAVDAQPQRRVDLLDTDLAAVLALDAPAGGGHEIGAEHVLERPARLQRLGAACRHRAHLLAQAAGFLAHHLQQPRARLGVDVGQVERLHRRLQVAERRTAALGQLVQQAVALRFGGEVVRDVVEQQHEAGECSLEVGSLDAGSLVAGGLVVGGLDGAHRRQLHAQQLAALRAGDELGRRMRDAALQALLHGFERMRHQRAVEDRVDRAAEAEQLGAVGERRRARQGTELGARAAVVQQDAAVEVAHHHALRELGHQRRQALALLLDAAAGLLHLRGDVGAQGAALLRQRVDDAGECARAGAALQRQLGLRLRRQHDLRLLGQPRRRGDPVQVDMARRRAQRERQDHPDEQQQGEARLELRPQLRAFGRFERGGEDATGEQRREREHAAGQRGGDDFAAVDAHGPWPQAPASSSRTLSASSRVENGLVT